MTVALATLGGPFGMLGGIAVLGIVAMAVSVIAKHGIDAVAIEIAKKLRTHGKTNKQIRKEIDEFPIITKDLKEKIKSTLKFT